MSANVTRGDMRDRVRFEADMVNSTRVTDANINALINTHLAELYDRLVAAGPPDYYATSSAIATVAGTIAYALPSDFRSLIGVFVNDSTTRRREVQPLGEGLRAAFDAPQGVFALTLEYVPSPPTLTTDSSAGTGVLDGVSGWDELVVQLCVRACRRRDGRDVSAIDQVISEARQRVMSNAPKRQQQGPRYVNDTETADSWPLYGVIESVNAWRLRGGFLDLYQISPVWP